jgi:hypothetical protein
VGRRLLLLLFHDRRRVCSHPFFLPPASDDDRAIAAVRYPRRGPRLEHDLSSKEKLITFPLARVAGALHSQRQKAAAGRLAFETGAKSRMARPEIYCDAEISLDKIVWLIFHSVASTSAQVSANCATHTLTDRPPPGASVDMADERALSAELAAPGWPFKKLSQWH